jgi:hypothetical protein
VAGKAIVMVAQVQFLHQGYLPSAILIQNVYGSSEGMKLKNLGRTSNMVQGLYLNIIDRSR